MVDTEAQSFSQRRSAKVIFGQLLEFWGSGVFTPQQGLIDANQNPHVEKSDRANLGVSEIIFDDSGALPAE